MFWAGASFIQIFEGSVRSRVFVSLIAAVNGGEKLETCSTEEDVLIADNTLVETLS